MVTSSEEGRHTSYVSDLAADSGIVEGTLKDLEKADVILTIGTDLTKDHQLAGFFVKRLIGSGAKVIPVNYETGGMDAFTPFSTVISKKNALAFIQTLESNINGQPTGNNSQTSDLNQIDFQKLAELLQNSENAVIVFGTDFEAKQINSIMKTLVNVSKRINARIMSFKGNANSLAASQFGLEKPFNINGHKAAFIGIGDEEPSQTLLQKIENAPFLVVQASYHSSLTAKADVVLPVTNWLEQEGHYVNANGKIQKANRTIMPSEEYRSNLEVLNLISERLNFSIEDDWKSALIEKATSVEIV